MRFEDFKPHVRTNRYAARFRTENHVVEERPRFVALVTVKARVGLRKM
jgi:hypothetical protein